MEKKLLFVSDLDGTIVDDQGRVPSDIQAAIRLFIREAGYFSIATGRGVLGTKHFDLPINCPSVFENGGKICFPNGRALRTFPFSKKEHDRLKRLMKKEYEHIDYAFFPPLDDPRYVFLVPDGKKREDILRYFALSFGHVAKDERDFFEEFEMGSARLAVVGNINVPSAGFNHSTNVDSAGVRYHEFNHHRANKGSGVLIIAEHLEIRLGRVIVAGNDMNDISMFRQPFGARLAVGLNCPDALLKHATHQVEQMAELPDVLRGLAREMLFA